MKKTITFTLFAIAIGFASFAQDKTSFEKGTNVINVGIGVGDVYWGAGYGSSGLPVSLNASYEHGITDKLGIGYIGVGAAFGYASQKYNDYGYGSWRSTGILIAARGLYHFAIPSEIGQKLDPYAGIQLGYVAVSTHVTNDGGYNGTIGKAGGVVVGFYAGARYHFNPHIGVYAELGYTSFSILSLGVAFRF
jgi:hypothetical protein